VVNLYTTYYLDEERQKELDTCLLKNVENSLIDNIYLFLEQDLSSPLLNNPKIKRLSYGIRPPFTYFFKIINRVSGNDDINIIANSDIYFDDTLSVINTYSMRDTCLALSRWDIEPDGSCVHRDRKDSQDSWIFKGKTKVNFDIPFTMGVAGCDNKLAYLLSELYNIYNPSKSIVSYHLHTTEKRTYKRENRLFPPYHLIQPTDGTEIPTDFQYDTGKLVAGRSNVKNPSIKILHISKNNGIHPSHIALHEYFKGLGQYREIVWSNLLKSKGVEYLRNHIIEVNEEFRPTLIFMQLQSELPIDVKTLKILKTHTPLIINWSGDVRKPTPRHYFDIGREIDLTYFTNMSDVEELRKEGINAEYMPIGFNPDYFYPIKHKEIVFFANNYRNAFPLSELRTQISNKLREKYGNRFGLYGINWTDADANLCSNPLKEAEILRNSKIAINLSQFDLKGYSSDRLMKSLGSGTLVLTHKFEGIEEMFDEGCLVTWETIDELVKKIDYYLEHEEERKTIAEKGCKFAHKNFTWFKLLDTIKNKQEEVLTPKIITFGDSHSYFNFKNISGISVTSITENKIFGIGAVTMHRAGRDMIRFSDYNLPKDKMIICCFGEIDVRCHIHNQLQKGRTEKDIISSLVMGYMNMLRMNNEEYKNIAVVSVVPPATDKARDNKQYPFVGTCEDRARYTKKLNKELEKQCKENGFKYLDIYNLYKDENDLLPYELSDGGCHISDNSRIKHLLKDFYDREKV